MNLFHFTTGRVRPASRRAGHPAARTGWLYNIRYAMTPRGPRREEVPVRPRTLMASWALDPVTGALTCHWHAMPLRRMADANTPSLHPSISMLRRDIHADMRPPTR